MKYYDSDGNPCSLDTLCRREPAWAASRLRHERELLQRTLPYLRHLLEGAELAWPWPAALVEHIDGVDGLHKIVSSISSIVEQ